MLPFLAGLLAGLIVGWVWAAVDSDRASRTACIVGGHRWERTDWDRNRCVRCGAER